MKKIETLFILQSGKKYKTTQSRTSIYRIQNKIFLRDYPENDENPVDITTLESILCYSGKNEKTTKTVMQKLLDKMKSYDETQEQKKPIKNRVFDFIEFEKTLPLENKKKKQKIVPK
ncbi:hypothetical protein [Helicobacter cappadocius]|uniref:Uncharacterized protein n=1 Tax=Helicobacter cappadocius TaxID=3063998 RepID=A0AA90PRN9_9HELI|nr:MULTISPECIES: hypothetical protein [unclassified Helicobacter]MDO7252362.1 hypothetical protein [Helicobacter sp. faydin-H75]MDP2538229.1 hypothetical protein [Helicobacter sp. faydin-H76]